MLPQDVSKTLACSIVGAHLDYCNSLLYGVPAPGVDEGDASNGCSTKSLELLCRNPETQLPSHSFVLFACRQSSNATRAYSVWAPVMWNGSPTELQSYRQGKIKTVLFRNDYDIWLTDRLHSASEPSDLMAV